MSIGLTTGLKALFAAQIAMQTAGHNIANANVEGYSRQSVLFRTDNPIEYSGVGFLGTGVKTAGVIHVVDELLEARIRSHTRTLGRLDKESSLLGQVEGIFNEPSDVGLSSLLGKFFTTVNDLSISPTDSTLRTDVVMAGQMMCDGFNTIATQLKSLQADCESELETKLAKVNELTQEIRQVTEKITGAGDASSAPNDLIDQRSQLCKELNQLVDAQIQENGGAEFAVLIGGRIVCRHGYQVNLELSKDGLGNVFVKTHGSTQVLNIGDGEVKGLLNQHNTALPELMDKMDTLAGQFIYEFNRVHSKGVPATGPFTFLKSSYRSRDLNLNADPNDEKLSEAGFPVPPSAGSLFVTVTEEATGLITQTEIEIDPDSQNLTDIAALLNSVPHLGAYADSQGFLNVNSEEGYTFDFSPVLNEYPDEDGTFGSRAASVVSTVDFPVTLLAGDTLTFVEDGANLPAVTFVAGSYTAAEAADEINNQTGKEIASVVDGRLVIQTTSEGSSSTLQILNTVGTPADTLGLSTDLDTGSDLEVAVKLEGAYTGSQNTEWTFKASGTGTIGVTPNLTVSVYDSSGALVDVLEVGASYSPGDSIEVTDGISVSFSAGEINENANDSFKALMIADSDSSGLLASLGLNSFFTGDGAQNIAVREDLVDNPLLIAGSLSHAVEDNANVLRLADMKDAELDGLGSFTIVEYFASTIGKLGLDKKWASDMQKIQETLMSNLENERASVSGVSIDEEMLNLEKYQQMLEAASRYLKVVSEVTDTLIAMV